MFHKNPQNKRNFSRQNDNNDNPSSNSDIQVHLADIKSEINAIKTATEDVLASTFNFFKSKLQEKQLVEHNLRDATRNLICEINFLRNIIGHNY